MKRRQGARTGEAGGAFGFLNTAWVDSSDCDESEMLMTASQILIKLY